MIKIKRNSDYKDKFRSYKIVLDEKVVGIIKDNQEVSLETSAGAHKLYLKIDWCYSNKIDFNNQDGETVNFECGNNVITIIALIYISFLRKKYLWLKKISN